MNANCLKAILLVLLSAAPAAAATGVFGASGASVHDHSTNAKGGGAVAPATSLTLPAASSAYINIPAPSTGAFRLAGLYNKSLMSGFVVFTSTGGTISIQNSLNVSSVTYISTGYYAVVWAAPMLTTDYACSGITSADPGNLGSSIVVISQTAGDLVKRRTEFRFRTYYAAADTVNNPERTMLICYGGAAAAGRN